MKSYKILLFTVLIIAVLTLISAFFPTDGIPVGSITLRFPSLEKMLTRNRAPAVDIEDIMSDIEPAVGDTVLKGLADSVNFYKSIVTVHPARFYLPGDNIHFFDELFEKMSHAKNRKKVVRVLHYGDSQIEMDRISDNLRLFFQSLFGGGGPGLLPVVQSIPTSSVYQYSSGDFTTYSSYGDGNRSPEKNYGIMARSYRMAGTAYFTVTASKNNKLDKRLHRFDRITLLLNDRKGNFTTMLNDKKRKLEIERESPGAGVQSFIWELDTPATSLSLTMQGEADIFGIMVDNGYGVNVDNIPLRGCSGTNFTLISDTLLAKSYQLADVGLIILQFGGNSVPGIAGEKSIGDYKKKIARQITYLNSIYPDAKILFIGPSDMSVRVNGELQTYPYLPAVNQALKEAANENGAAFWDMYAVMGGYNSMITWVNSGFAGNDYIHFTPAGANKIGNTLSNSFSTMFEFYQFQKTTDKETFEEMWNEEVLSTN